MDRISEKCATMVSLSGEWVAVFRYDGKVSAISNVCQHQNGPLGEGRIIDGCVTCPWHGYQHQPKSGAAPAPFKEKIPTFRVKVIQGSVFVHPQPGFDGKQVRLQGQLMYREDGTMVEVTPGSIKLADIVTANQSLPNPETMRDLGAVTLTGEIVDSSVIQAS